MAKEQWHSWGRYILLAIVIIFSCGGYVFVVKANSDDIDKVETKVESIEEDVHALELNQRDEIAMKKQLIKTLERFEVTQTTISVNQQKMTNDITEIRVRIENPK